MRALCAHGLSALVQSGAGAAIGLSDALHQSAGAVARTSTFALNNATLPFVMALANQGWQRALQADPHLLNGLNVCAGRITSGSVATALGLDWQDPRALLQAG